jgi:hypothetical protein
MEDKETYTREEVAVLLVQAHSDGYIQGRSVGQDMTKKELRGLLALQGILKGY